MMKDHFEHGNSLFVIFSREGGVHKEDITKVRAWTREIEQTENEILQVNSPFSIRIGKREGNHQLWFYRLVGNDNPIELTKLKDTPWEKLVTSKSFDDIGVEIILRDTPGGSKLGRFDPAPVTRIVDQLGTQFPSEKGLQFHVVGSASFSEQVLKGIRLNSRLNLITIVAIILFIKLFYGSFRGGLLLTLNLVFSGICAFGVMALFDIPIDILNSGIFMMLSVAGLEDFIFLSNLRQSVSDENWDEPFKEILVPSFFTSLTTIIGFGSLYFSDILIIQKFGLVAAFGAMVEWVAMFVFTPALLKVAPGLRSWTNRPLREYSFLKKISQRSINKVFAKGLLIVFLMIPFALYHLNTVDSPLNLLPHSNPFNMATDHLETSRNWKGELSIVFLDEDNKAINQQIISEVKKSPYVEKVDDPYAQKDFWTMGFDPLTKDLIDRSLKQTTMYKRIFSNKTNETRSVVYVRTSYTDSLSALLAKIKKLCGEGKYCYPAGELVSYSEFSEHVLGALFRSLGSSLLLVGSVILITCYRFNRIKQSPFILMACFWGVAFMLVIVSGLQIRVNFMTCVFASVLVGLTGDNGIQFLFSGRNNMERGIVRHAPASIVIGIIMSITCLLFLSAAFVPPRIFGVLLAIGILSSLVGDIWLMKSFSKES